jgi:hypothetical protein
MADSESNQQEDWQCALFEQCANASSRAPDNCPKSDILPRLGADAGFVIQRRPVVPGQ